MNINIIILLYFCICLSAVNSAKILGIFHVTTKSHNIICNSVAHGLAAKGHELTILSPFASKENKTNIKEIYLDGVKIIGEEAREKWSKGTPDPITFYVLLSNLTNQLTEKTLRSKAMTNLLNSNEKFDVVLIEPFGNEAFFGLGHYFNAQMVVISTASSMWVTHLSGNTEPYSYVPNTMSPYSDRMSFFERIFNSIYHILFGGFIKLLSHPVQKQLYEEFFKNAPPFEETIKNASLFLINSNVILETPRPYLPNMIPVGGLHVKKPKQLSKDLQEFLDSASEGAILFSLGSNVHSNLLKKDTISSILNTFAKLPQKVLWKFEGDLPGAPDNLKIGKWLPQSDILAHPNIKLFITHGGLLSSTEALYRGVPILGIPFYGDQEGNIKSFVQAGYGELLFIKDLTEKTFTDKITTIINKPKYSQNIKKHSNILNDQLNEPLDRAVFWVEHIIKHGGNHLRAASNDLSYSQYLLLDIITFVLFILISIVFIIYFIIKRLCTSRKNKYNDIKKRM